MIENALKIDGWMAWEDLEWLAEKARAHQRIVELGCWRGRSTTCLADNTSGVVYAVDHWRGSDEHQPLDPEQLYQGFLSQMRSYIDSGKVIPIRKSSVEVAEDFHKQGVVFDMVFIDASHDYESVKADILAWKPLCHGLLCGHDAPFEQVRRAAQELLPGLYFEHSMWALELP